ncbi:hypothetical protein OG194_06665 [Streptomyces sp. NBC_01288]|uniref:hypothetical protein n=1 Tax=Streptomyces sp. NBC_01288 TaxID=2903814 RepID=UPI002E1685B8|nr:hypothetical protein OG194_06665 [Streptomyces sp. NBC_01288]
MSKLTQRRRSAVLVGAGAAAALCLLVACGGGGGGAASDDHGVASVSSPAAKGGSARPDADDASGRPQLRLDTSRQEQDRLTFVYLDCLRDHGVPGGRKPGSSQWFPGAAPPRTPPPTRPAS